MYVYVYITKLYEYFPKCQLPECQLSNPQILYFDENAYVDSPG